MNSVSLQIIQDVYYASTKKLFLALLVLYSSNSLNGWPRALASLGVLKEVIKATSTHVLNQTVFYNTQLCQCVDPVVAGSADPTGSALMHMTAFYILAVPW